MLEFLFLIVVFYFIIRGSKKTASGYNISETMLKRYFSNVGKVATTSTMNLYTGDKAAENFLLAIKKSYSPISNVDLSTIYDLSEKLHLHSKILFTSEVINPNTPLAKRLKEYEIQVLSATDFQKLLNGSETVSVLKTSDTSDDDCKIDESTNPIQFEKSSVRSILSFFRDKPERL